MRRLLSENEILKQTFVLACDVSERAPPLETFAETLFASTKGMEKDYDLLRVLSDLEEKYDKNELLSPTRFADLLAEFVNESKRKFQKTPKFLVLIDELGYGTIKRIDEYADSKFTKEELIEDIRRFLKTKLLRSFIFSITFFPPHHPPPPPHTPHISVLKSVPSFGCDEPCSRGIL